MISIRALGYKYFALRTTVMMASGPLKGLVPGTPLCQTLRLSQGTLTGLDISKIDKYLIFLPSVMLV